MHSAFRGPLVVPEIPSHHVVDVILHLLGRWIQQEHRDNEIDCRLDYPGLAGRGGPQAAVRLGPRLLNRWAEGQCQASLQRQLRLGLSHLLQEAISSCLIP